MELRRIEMDFTVCKIADPALIDFSEEFCFVGKTDEELSLVCPTKSVPETLEREDGWRAFCIRGVLDFSLIGILSRISAILAENGIGLFAVSTFNTDYILVKQENYERTLSLLAGAGYSVC